MRRTLFVILLACFCSLKSFAQCAPGVVSAGNPSCIPQDRFESPVYQGPPPPGYSGNGAASGGRPLDAKYGAFAIDRSNHVSFAYLLDSDDEARQSAMEACQSRGGTNCQALTFRSVCGALVANKYGEIWLGTGRAGQDMNDAYQKCTAKDPRGQCHLLSLSVCSIPQDDANLQRQIADKAAHATPAELTSATSKLGESRSWYGAFAYGPNEDSVHISMDDNDKDVSVNRALAQCTGVDCKLLDWINRQCGGIGLPADPAKKGQFIATTSNDPNAVREQLMQQCHSKFGTQCVALVRCTGEKYGYPDNNPFVPGKQVNR